jgi:hypothetical protein
MHFSKIYIQDNFVPNIVEDQFRRKVIGIEVTISSDESITRAEQLAGDYIKDYIQKNTVANHAHIEERYIPENELPQIQVDKEPEIREQTLEEQIRSCTDLKVLESYVFIAKKEKSLQDAYNSTMEKLLKHK